MLPSTYNASAMLRSDYGPLERIGALDSSVFRGRGNDGAFVALRFLRSSDPAVRARVGQIAQTASGIRHPMLAATGGCQRFADDALCIVSEYVPGQPLDRWVSEHGLPPLRMTVDLVRRVSLGLHAMHQRDLTHGALHPANLIVLRPDTRPGGRVVAKLLDIGVPSWLRASPPRLSSAHFAAPELLPGTDPPNLPGRACDPNTDVYACGALLYYLCTGGAPFQCVSLPQLIAAAGAARPIQRPSYINPELPCELEDVMLRALAIDPGERVASASELALMLSDVESLWSDSGVRRRDSVELHKRRPASPDAVTPVVNLRGLRGTHGTQSSAKLESNPVLPRGVAREQAPAPHLALPKPVTPRAHVAPSGTYSKLEWPPKRPSRAGLALVALSTLLAAYAAYLGSLSRGSPDGRAKQLPSEVVAQRDLPPPPARARSSAVPTETPPAQGPPQAVTLATGSRARRSTVFAPAFDSRAAGRGERTRTTRSAAHRARDADAQLELEAVAAKTAGQPEAAKVVERELHEEAQPDPSEPAALVTKRPLATPPSLAQSTPAEAAQSRPAPASRPTGSDAADDDAAGVQAPVRTVEIGEVRVRGSLSPSVVRRAVDRIGPLLRRCVQQTAQQGRGARAELTVSTTIDEIGRARTPTAQGSAPPALRECVVAAAAKLVADRPDTGTVDVTWTVGY